MYVKNIPSLISNRNALVKAFFKKQKGRKGCIDIDINNFWQKVLIHTRMHFAEKKKVTINKKRS